MLYKILLVITSIVGMLASSLLPAGLVAPPDVPGEREENAPATLISLERLATLGDDGSPGAPVSVLWVELEGRRVDEDVKAQGYLKELRFKVGLRPAPSKSLQIGDSILTLTPTDVITVREFSGRFGLQGSGGVGALLALDGEVQATFVNEAHVQKIATEGRQSVPKTQANLAYVVLDVGEKRTTVDLAPGGDRVATGSERNGTAPIPVAWIRVGDRVLSEYTWAEGFADSIEFLAKPAKERLIVGSDPKVLAEDTRVLVQKFVGTYILFEEDSGGLLLKLDGYAENITTLPGKAVRSAGLAPKPTARFDFQPDPPSTSDSVAFADRSTATPGTSILLREWNFGDGTVSTAQNPRHRFKEPGRAYPVTLVVTDSNLERSDPYTLTVTPLNSKPVAEFDFAPKLVTDIEEVRFTDRSWDVDGPIAGWLWEFGDGQTSTEPSPNHRFADNGTYTVKLTVRDGQGATSTIAKLVGIANVGPSASFSFAPTTPSVLDNVEFRDLSGDPDGTIAKAEWDFGDGSTGLGRIVHHRYAAVGEYVVRLLVTDNDGATAATDAKLSIVNLPPVANFEVITAAEDRTTGKPICFRDVSTDDENNIVSRTWRFGASGASTAAEPCYTFPSTGPALVNLTVRDGRGAIGWVERTFLVLNGAPQADFLFAPVAPSTKQTVVFTSSATDPDGPSDIVSYLWYFPHDGQRASGASLKSHSRTFQDNGDYLVFLNVTDSAGHWSNQSRAVTVSNRAPQASFVASTPQPIVGQTVTFVGTFTDADGTVEEVVWSFDDGFTLRGRPGTGNFSRPTHAFRGTGLHQVSVVAIDNDFASSPAYSVMIDVQPPPPTANFSWAPSIPIQREGVQFADASFGVGTNVVQWAWEFPNGDTSALRNPQYAFPAFGNVPVTLTVRDDANPAQVGSVTKTVLVNARPDADFSFALPVLHEDVQFTDRSADVDGAIVNWTWDFGDRSSVSHAQNPVHRYDAPGDFAITLTVLDDHGATASATTILRVANRDPTAGFAFAPGQPMANTTTTFTSTSTDLDGVLTAWEWTITTADPFPRIVGVGAGPVFPFVFRETGQYVVQLVVRDGDGGSSRTETKLRVLSDAVKSLSFGLTYPDGSPFDFGTGTVVATASLKNGLTGAVAPVPAAIAGSGPGRATLSIPNPVWAAADQVTLSFKSVATGRDAGAITLQLLPGASQISASALRLLLKAQLEAVVLPPTSAGLFAGPDSMIAPGVYAFADQTERVQVTFRATWEGTTNPVRGATFDVSTMWVGGRGWFPSGDAGLPLSRRETTAATTAIGEVLYPVPYSVPVLSNAAAEPLPAMVPAYVPGWYRVSAVLSLPNYTYPAILTTSAIFYEDPGGAVRAATGNLLVSR